MLSTDRSVSALKRLREVRKEGRKEGRKKEEGEKQKCLKQGGQYSLHEHKVFVNSGV